VKLVLPTAVLVTAMATTTGVWSDEQTACRERWATRLCASDPNEEKCRNSVLSECIAHCDTGCWVGYAWNRYSKRFEWSFRAYESHSECLGAAKSTMEGADSYREPFGCGYVSTSLWRTILMNKLWGPKELVCIAKAPNDLVYALTFEILSAKEEKEGTLCIFDLPYKATVLARRVEELAKQNAEDAILGCHESKGQKEIRRERERGIDPIPWNPRLEDCTTSANTGENWPYQHPPCINNDDTECYADVPPAVVPRKKP
jgi:hypothetical protein